jgi:dTDP-4-dehydrorhamnose 3,5-epimerase
MMKLIETSLPGAVLIEPAVRQDERGFFLESYHQRDFFELGITEQFVQDNHSKSIKGTLRGLHYQLRHPQAKLCRVVHGEVLDVVVDIRKGSPHFGRHMATTLSAENKRLLYIARGFAHGFLVLSDTAEFLYKCSDFYQQADERGVLWSDPDLGIDWGNPQPILSAKDQLLPQLTHISPVDLPDLIEVFETQSAISRE